MSWKTRLRSHLGKFGSRADAPVNASNARALDVLDLEDRIMYSAVPIDLAGLADAIDQADTGEATVPENGQFDAALAEFEDNSTLTQDTEDQAQELDTSIAPALASEGSDSSVRTELVFIDAQVDDVDQLLADLQLQNDETRQLHYVLLEGGEDGVRQITDALAEAQGVDAVHIVSHGSATGIQLGNTWLSHENINAYTDQFAQWDESLVDAGDLLFYGCDLAATEDGRQLMDAIGAACNCDVAASDDVTGHVELGGDWDLEFAVGVVEARSAFSVDAQDTWLNKLAGYTVINTNDSGAGSLRQAIIDANANSGLDTIDFNISGSGVHTIALDSALDIITDSVILDATTQAGGSFTTPLIYLTKSGSYSGGDTAAIVVEASNSTVSGFIVGGFADEGIEVSGFQNAADGDNNIIEYNWIGFDATGAADGVGDDGILVTTDADDNVIRNNVVSSSGGDGIQVRTNSDNNWVWGNTIGLATDGTASRGNAGHGIHLSGVTDTTTIGTDGDGTADISERNVIGSNTLTGIYVDDSTNVVIAGNYIGVDSTGNVDRGNTTDGIFVTSSVDTITIGGTAANTGNVISGNADAGLEIDGADNIDILGNIIGLGADGTTIIENDGHGIMAYGTVTNLTIGGNTANDRNVISGNVANAIGVYGGSGWTIQGNYIGTDVTGLVAKGNQQSGIAIVGVDNVQIGGTSAGEGNVISGNLNSGVYVQSADGVIIEGNSIGVGSDGATAIGNDDGVHFEADVTGSIFGGSSAASANIIAYGTSYGVFIKGAGSTQNQIRRNSIYQNDGLGIDHFLGGNTELPGPVLKTVAIADDGTFAYELDTTGLPSGTYDIEFYASSDRNGGTVQGERYLGFGGFVPWGNGSYSGSIGGVTLAPGEYVTALVTETTGNGTTSEFSNYAVATDSDAGGADPADLQATSTTGGGLSINEDGGNDTYLEADDGSAVLGGLTEFSVEVQLSMGAAPPTFPHIIDYATSSEDREFSLLLSGDTVRVTIKDNSYGFAGTYSELRDGNVHSIGVTRDSGGVLKLYIDGDYKTQLTGVSSAISSGGNLVIGNDQDSMGGSFATNQYVEGAIHDLRIFDDVRTDAEIESSYRSTLPHDEANMIANWRFDALSTDGVVTEAVSGNNLTIKHVTEGGFTASEASLTFSLDENPLDGRVVGLVSGVDAEREALIATLLAANTDLYYNTETGKFYEFVDTGMDWTTADTNAQSSTLNGINGQLVSIGSAHENQLVVDMMNDYGRAQAWLGASDATIEDVWRWNGGEQFWQGDGNGYNVDDQYTNWDTGNPNDFSGQDYAKIFASTGKWDDVDGTASQGSIIEYDADAVLDNAGGTGQQPLTYSIQSQTVAGAFEIDADTGEIRVLDGTLLDADTQATHTVTVRVTDVDSNTYDEAFTISLNDLVENNNAPSDLSSGIELNTDGGNDAYLLASDGGAILGGLTQFTFESTFQIEDQGGEPTLFSYYNGGDEARLRFDVSDHLRLKINNVNVTTANSYSELLDGETHHVAVSWDNSNGDVHFYIDGKYAESITGLASGHALVSGGTLSIGNEQDGPDSGYGVGQAFHGTLYDVRVWNEVRSEAEISLNYQQKFDSGNVPSGLVANWQMEFNGSNEVVDIVSESTTPNRLSVANTTTQLTLWSNQSGGVTADGSTLSFDATGNTAAWGTAQANSATFNSLGFTDNYTMSFTVDDTIGYKFMVGLGLAESNASFTDIDHAIYFDVDVPGEVVVYKNGSISTGYNLGYVAGDEFSFYVNGTTLEYQHNGTTFRTETITANENWYVDTAFHGTTGTATNESVYSVSNFHLIDGNATGFVGSTPVEDLHISENANNGESVGFVVPSDPDTPQDVVNDGLFLEGDNGSWQPYTLGQTFGGWIVTGGDGVDHTSQYPSPLGGVGVELERGVGDVGGTITQTLSTEAGRQYQVIFSAAGNFSGGDAVKHMRASADGVAHDYAIEDTGVYERYSFTFTASDTTSDLSFQGLRETGFGAVISDVQVIEIPQAVSTILNSDPTLEYDAATGKFYKVVDSTFTDATTNIANANATLLNDISGQLATIRSAYEDDLIQDLIYGLGGEFLLGGTDATVDGEWNWVEDGAEADRFWNGGTGGSAPNGAYAAFNGEPGGGTSESYLAIRSSDGVWLDTGGGGKKSVIEWNANEVLSNFTFSLTDDAGGRFAIDNSTGEIAVGDGTLLDYETATSHDVDVTVTDAAGNSYMETMTIAVDNGVDAQQTVPPAQTIDEDTTLTFSSGAATEVSVSDSLGATDSRMRVTLSVNDGVLNLSQTTDLTFIEGADSSGSLIIDGTESNINAALEGMTFTPDQHFNGAVTLDMTTALAADLEGHYTFEGGNADDQAAGTADNGAFIGNATTTTDAERGEVLSLDGDGDYVEVNSAFGEPQSVTLSTWVNVTGIDTGGATYIEIGSGVGIWTADFGAYNMGVQAFAYDGSTFQSTGTTENIIGTGWRHLAMTHDAGTNTLSLYLDGKLIGELTTTGPLDYGASPATTMGAHDTLNRDVTGMIDDTRVYSRALSADEIAALAGDQTEASDSVAITVDAVNDTPTFELPGELVFTAGDSGYNQNLGSVVLADGSMLMTPYEAGGGNSILVKLNADGSIDTSFGTNGYADNSSIGYIQSAEVHPDGKILVSGMDGGSIFLARYNADGSVDMGFGSSGVATPSGGSFEEATDIAVQSDGSIIVVGEHGDDSVITRFTSTGTHDTTFGTSGTVLVNLGSTFERLESVTVLSDDSIIAVGETSVVKMDSDGNLDNTFDSDGILNLGNFSEGVAVQADGKFVVTGGTGAALFVTRFNANGSIDSDFGTSGTTTWLTAATGHDVAVQADGKLVVAGFTDSYPSQWVVVRFNTDGSLDTSFGTGGAWVQTTSVDYSEAYSVGLYNDGTSEKIVIGGYTYRDGFGTAALSTMVRLNHDGTLDDTLGTNTLDGNPTFTEGGPAVVLDEDVQFFDADINRGEDNFDTVNLVLQRNGGANGDDVFSATGNLVFQGNTDVDLSGTTIGTIIGNTGGLLNIEFNATATEAQVNEVLQSIAYSNSSDAPPASVMINWSMEDANSLSEQGSGGNQFASGSTTVNITAVNDIVVANDDTESTNEDTAHTFDPRTNDSDGENDTLTIVDVGQGTNGTVVNNGDGTVTYTPTGDYNGPDSFEYVVRDSGSGLQHYWGLDGNANDSVGTADGTLNGTTTVAGDVGNALFFDELNSEYVQIPDFAYNSEFTVSFEFKVDEINGSLFQYLYSHGDINGFNSINVFMNEDGHSTNPNVLRTVARDANDSLSNTALEIDISASGLNLVDDQFHTYTLTAGSDGLKVYIDGVLAASDATRGTDGFNPAGDLYLGRRSTSPADRYFDGVLDSVQVYDNALSQSQISDLDAGTNRGTVNMTVNPVNDAPTITNLGGDTLNYDEGDGAVIIDQSADALVTDIDSADFDTGTLTVSLQSGGVNAEDVLAIANQGTGSGQIGISGSDVSYEGTVIGTFVGGTGGSDLVITFDTDADATAVSALIQAITYENVDDETPTAGNRTVRYVLTDGDSGTSANYDTTVSVSAVNDAPIDISVDEQVHDAQDNAIVVIGSQTGSQNTSATLTSGRTVSVYINGDHIDAEVFDASGNSLTGQYQILDGKSYSGLASARATNPVVAELPDGGFVVVSQIRGYVANGNHNDAIIMQAFDANGNEITLSPLTGQGHVLVSGNSGAGQQITPTLDVAGDGTITVSWNNTTSGQFEERSFKIHGPDVAENATTGTVVATLSGVDPEGDALTYSVVGVNNDFEVVGNQIRVKAGASLDYESNPYPTVTVRADDGNGGTYDEVITVAVTNVNEAPAFTNLDGNPTFVEDSGTPVVLDPDVTVFDDELSAVDDFNGATLTLVRNGGANSDDAFSATGTLAPLNQGANNLIVGATTIGSVTTNSGGTLVLTFNGNATNSLVNQALQQIAYSNGSDTPPASVQIDWTFNDGGDSVQTQGGTALQAAGSTVVNIVDVDEAAFLTVPIAQSVDEDNPLTFSVGGINAIVVESGSNHDPIVTATLSVSNGTLTLATTAGITFLDGTSDGDGTLTISGTESAINTALDGLQYQGNQDYNGSDTLTVTTGSDAAVEANLHARYEFLNGSLEDETTNNFDGTANGDPTLTTDPERGDVLTFDGNDRVDVANSVSTLGDEVTIAAWVNLDAGQQDNIFLSIGDEFYVILDNSNPSLSMGLHVNGFTTSSLSSTHNIAGEGWNHVAATFNDISKETYLYLNGELVRSSTFSFSDVDWSSPDSPNMTIGALSDGSNAFTGSLDDVRVYNSELSQSEIIATMGDNGYDSETVNITVDAVNDNPTNSGGILTDVTVTEDILSDVDLSAVNFNDVDANGSNLTVTLTTSTGGELTLEADGSLTFGGNATARTITGTLADLNAYFDDPANIQYLHSTENINGTSADTISVVINDNGNTGSGGGTDQNLGNVNVDITAVNDGPTVNTGFDDFIADFGGSDSTSVIGKTTITSDNRIAIDSDQTYDISVTANSGDGGGGNYDAGETQYIGFNSYDIDGNLIASKHTGQYAGSTDTTLAVDLVAGATQIVLTDATGWYEGTFANNRTLAWYGYTNSFGETYADYTYTRNLAENLWDENGIDHATNTITLKTAWTGPTILAGEAVRNSSPTGGTYQYPVISNAHIDETGGTFTATIGGGFDSGSTSQTLFRHGTAYIEALVLANYTATTNQLNVSDFTIQTSQGTTLFTEDGGPIAISDSDFSITDPDDSYVESVTITLTDGRVGDILNVNETAINALGISVTGIPAGSLSADGSITLTLTSDTANTVTPADYKAAIDEITFDNNSDDPNTIDRLVTFVANDGNDDSATEELVIKVHSVDDAPVVSTTALDPTFTEDGSAVSVFGGTTIDAVEAGDNIGSFVISIAGVADGANEQYRINGEFIRLIDGNTGITDDSSFNYDVSVNAGVATLTITMDSPVAGVTAAAIINNSVYQNTSDAPSGTTRTVTLESVTEFELDGVNDTTTVGTASVVTIAAVNDQPDMIGQELIDNGTFDTDISGWTTTGQVEHESGELRFGSANSSGPHTASQTLTTEAGETYRLTFDYRDDSQTRNQSLQVTVDGSSNLLTTSQIITDKDDNSFVRYEYEFTADSSSSTLTFTDTSDTAGVSDGTTSVDGYIDNVSVKQLSGDLHSIAITEGDGPTVLYPNADLFDPELSTADDFGGLIVNINRVGGNNASDEFSATGLLGPLTEGGNLVYNSSIVGSVNTNSGGSLNITFASGVDNATANAVVRAIAYENTSENPATNYRLNINVNDGNFSDAQGTGGDLFDSAYVTVNMTAENDVPVISDLDGDSLSYFEGDGPVVVDQGTGASVTDVDSADFDGGNLTVTSSTTGDNSEDQLSIRNQGTGAGQIGFDGTNVTYQNVLIGTASGGSNGADLIVSLNSNADAAAVSAMTQNVTYENSDTSNPTEDSRTISFVVNDGKGGTSASNDVTISVNRVNDAPAGANNTVTPNEDVDYTFATGDFGFSDTDGNNLSEVVITTIPTNGTLYVDANSDGNIDGGEAISATDSIAVADITSGRLKFKPAANANGSGYDSFTFQVRDDGGTANGGVDTDQTPNTMTIDVNSVNDEPAGADNTVTTNEDTDYAFAAGDFGFSDPIDGDSLSAVVITTIPTNGTLYVDANSDGNIDGGEAISATDSIAVADITAGRLKFKPAANANGSGYDSFTFQVRDDGGTANGGVDTDQSPNTMTIDVNSVNDEPAGADNTVTTNEDTDYAFAAGDFGFTDPIDGDSLSAVVITTIPTNGTLYVDANSDGNVDGGEAVSATQAISVADITAGRLKFKPAANANGTGYDSFTFQVRDDGGTANGGQDTDQSANTMTIDVNAVNDEPAGADNTVTTNENTDYAFAAGDFGFSDSIDGDSLSAVVMSTLPSNGTLYLDANDDGVVDGGEAVLATETVAVSDITAGRLKFKPAANANGSGYDSFTFQVRDDGGTANGGVDTDQSPNTMTIDVNSVNDEPAGADNTVSTNEDTDYFFGTGDFGFTDPIDGDSLAAVVISTGPGNGTLYLDANSDGNVDGGEVVSATDTIAVADITAGRLKFKPAANANGTGYDSFTFQVRDDGGTANGGVDTDQSPNTMAIDVAAINDDPTNVGSLPSDVAVTEDVLSDVDFSPVDLADPDSGAGSLTVTLTTSTGGNLTASTGGGVTVGGSGTGVLTLTGTLASLNTYLDTASNIQYLHGTPGTAGNDADSILFEVTDSGNTGSGGGGTISLGTANVDIGTVNDPPINVVPGTQTVLEETTTTISGISVSDSDAGSNLITTQLQVTNGVLNVTLSGAATIGAGLNGSGDLTISGSAADINATLASLTYTGNTNLTGVAADLLVVTTDDLGNTGSGGALQDVDNVQIDITNVNDAPGGSNNTVTTSEDADFTFAAGDFGFSDPIGGDALSAVVIATLPANGVLYLDANSDSNIDGGEAVSASDAIAVADIAAGRLKFKPAANANGTGYDSFTFQVRDDGGTANGGVDTDQTPNTMTIDVGSVNDEPAGADNTITTNEDTDYAFAAGDFGFSDTDGDTLSAIVIATIPSNGTLYLDSNGDGSIDGGEAVSATNAIAVADITAGRLNFKPAANANGTGYDSFTFQVRDDGGIANGGQDTDQSPNTMTIDVNSVNDEPAGADNTVTTNEDTDYVFGTGDFGFTDPIDGDSLAAVVISTVTSNGTLYLDTNGDGNIDGGEAVSATNAIAVADIAAGRLKFKPAANANGTGYDSFTFQVRDDGGTANGGVDTDQSPNTMAIDVTAINDDPTNAGSLPSDVVVTEDLLSNVDLSAINLMDVDAGVGSLTITLATSTGGELTVAAGGGVTLGGTPTSRTFTGTLSNLNAYLNNASNIQYLHPTANLNGDNADTISVLANDNGNVGSGGGADQNLGTVNVDIISVNDQPTTLDAIASGPEDSVITITLTGSDLDGTVQSFEISSLPANGTLYLDAGLTTPAIQLNTYAATSEQLTVYFQPNSDWNGLSTFNFAATDNQGLADTTPATATITVTGVNDNPTNAGSLPSDIAVTEDVLADIDLSAINLVDVDAAGGSLTITLSTSAGGNLNATSSGGVIVAGSGTGTLTLDGTLANLNSFLDTASNIRYLHGTPGTNGDDADTIQVDVADNGNTGSGGGGSINLGIVNVDIGTVNDPPVNTIPGTQTVNEETPTAIAGVSVLDPDAGSNPISTRLQVTNGVLNVSLAGSATLSAGANGTDDLTIVGIQADINATLASLQYTGNADITGLAADTLLVTTNDQGNTGAGGAQQDVDGITINISNLNDAPTSSPESYNTLNTQTLTVASPGVLANDFDIDSPTLTAILVTPPAHGVLTLQADGSFEYVPLVSYVGQVEFTYQAFDGSLLSSPVTVTIDTAVVPDNPYDPEDPGDGGGDDGSDTNPPEDPTQDPTPTPSPNPPPSDEAPAQTTPPSRRSPASPGLPYPSARDRPLNGPSNEFAPEDEEESIGNLSGSRLGKFVMGSSQRHIMDANLANSFTTEEYSNYNLDLIEYWLDAAQEEQPQDDTATFSAGAATSLAIGLSAGYVAWTVRGAYLVAALAGALPTWARFDPIYVFDDPEANRKTRELGETDLSLAEIVQSQGANS